MGIGTQFLEAKAGYDYGQYDRQRQEMERNRQEFVRQERERQQREQQERKRYEEAQRRDLLREQFNREQENKQKPDQLPEINTANDRKIVTEWQMMHNPGGAPEYFKGALREMTDRYVLNEKHYQRRYSDHSHPFLTGMESITVYLGESYVPYAVYKKNTEVFTEVFMPTLAANIYSFYDRFSYYNSEMPLPRKFEDNPKYYMLDTKTGVWSDKETGYDYNPLTKEYRNAYTGFIYDIDKGRIYHPYFALSYDPIHKSFYQIINNGYIDLAGTRWEGKDSDNQYSIFIFKENGVLHYGSGSVLWTDGFWKQVGDTVFIDVNNKYAHYEATIINNGMEGNGRNIKGMKWTFERTKS